MEVSLFAIPEDITNAVSEYAKEDLVKAISIHEKLARQDACDLINKLFPTCHVEVRMRELDEILLMIKGDEEGDDNVLNGESHNDTKTTA